LLSLSGHGFKDRQTFYFAPVGLDPQKMSQTGLPWKELITLLQAARQQAKAVWVLADCCRAAPDLGRERRATGADLKCREGGGGRQQPYYLHRFLRRRAEL